MLTAKTEAERLAMNIPQISAHRVRVPLYEPFRISNGVVAEKESILVEVKTDRGVTGWGEASPMSGSFYSEDTPDSVWSALRERLIPFALDLGGINPPRYFENLRDFTGDAFAKAGLEGAVWDAYARSLNIPLYRLLGGSYKAIPSGLAVGIYDTVAELVERVDRYVADGYRRVKIKIQPDWDIEPVAALRERYPELALMVDANAAYTIRDLDIFRRLDDFDLMMFEQPLARGAHDESSELQQSVRTPICADE
jgi:o-succinylbenzoate synthase